jgi:hypothetical protein
VAFYLAGADIRVLDNLITEHFEGISTEPVGAYDRRRGNEVRLRVQRNRITTMANSGIMIGSGGVDQHWSDNVIVGAKIALRLQDPTTGPVYIYNNQFVQGLPVSGGPLIYVWQPAKAAIYLYHNTFVGQLFTVPTVAHNPNSGATRMERLVVVNNIINVAADGGVAGGGGGGEMYVHWHR